MLLEGLVALACVAGNERSCNNSLQGYVKFNKLDEKAATIEQDLKKTNPSLHFTAVLAGTMIQKKYQVMLYKNTWYINDYSENKNMIVFTYSY